ncbi:MAG: Tim44-like domain-containing protein [Gammaproteobacteria bacterium]|nr:Tim44-like domain-containing protein [Gammaproteobacteria bacterium]
MQISLLRRHKNFLISFVSLVAIIFCTVLYARAGGGGGHGGGGGGILGLILWPLMVAYSAIVSGIAINKKKHVDQLLAQLSQADSVWDLSGMRNRIVEAFYALQNAWAARNQNLAKGYMSEALYLNYKAQTDAMLDRHDENVLDQINLDDFIVVDIDDFLDDTKDYFWVLMKGSMIDYHINDTTGQLISGDRDTPESFRELWQFVRENNQWVVNRINSSAGITDVAKLHAYSERIQKMLK